MPTNVRRPPFPESEFADRLTRTRRRMSALDLDVLIVCHPTNLNYLTGYDGWSFYVHQFAVIGHDGPPLWIGRAQDVDGARMTTVLNEDRIIGYPDEYVQSDRLHPMQFVADILRTRHPGKARIGIEADSFYFTGKSLDVLRESLPEAAVVDAGLLVNRVRTVKSEREIAYIREAARISEAIMSVATEMIDVGVRQCDLAAEIWRTGLRGVDGYGGDYPAIAPLMPTGAGSGCPHLTWNDQPFEAETSSLIEISGVRHHYHAPLTRTVWLGTAPEAMRRAADAMVEGVGAVLDAVRPGILARDAHAAWNDTIHRHGLVKDSRVGYSIGLGFPPDWGEQTVSFRSTDETVLEPGMTIHCMPGMRVGDWGMAISETIVITESGCEAVCRFPRRLIVKPGRS